MPRPPSFTCTLGQAAELADTGAPVGEDGVALALVAAETDRAANMVQHDLRRRKGARQVDQVGELRMVHPGIEAQTKWRQLREAFTHAAVEQQALRPDGGWRPTGPGPDRWTR